MVPLNARLKAGTWWCWALLLAAAFLAINHLPVRGRAVPVFDAKDSFFPFFVLVADHVRAGHLVSWDPWSNAGMPRFSDPEFGAFAPLQILVGAALGGTTWGFIAYWLLIWLSGGIGLMALARHLNVPGWGAFVVAISYLFSGVYTGHAEHISWLNGFSALPFIIWRLDVALVRRRWLAALESGAAWGMSAIAAYPGMTIVTGLFIVVWTIGRVVGRADSGAVEVPARADQHHAPHRTSWGRAAVSLVSVVAVGTLILLPVYVSFFYEGAGVHARTGPLPRVVAISSNALDPRALVTAISPYFARLKYTESLTMWPSTDVSSCSVYVGALVLTLAILALVSQPRSVWRWYLAAVAAVCLMLAVGPALPLRGWLYDWVYPTRFFRHAALFRLYAVFVVSTLALLGVTDLAGALGAPPARRRRITVSMAVVAAIAIVSYFVMLPAWARSGSDARLGQMHVLVVWGAVAGAALLSSFISPLRRQVWIPLVLGILSSGDALLAARLSQNTIFSVRPDVLTWWSRQDRVHNPDITLTAPGLERTRWACESDPPCQEPNSWSMITKVPALDTYTPATNAFHDAIKAHAMLRGLAVGSNRVWFSSTIAVVRPDLAEFSAFVKRTEAAGRPPMLIHPRQTMLGAARVDAAAQAAIQIETLTPAESIAIDLERYTPGELAFSVQAPREGWLLITDRWARSWSAMINGRPAPVSGGNFIFRAVPVSQGLNRVSFVYRPLGFPWLLLASWGTLAMIATASLTAHFLNRFSERIAR